MAITGLGDNPLRSQWLVNDSGEANWDTLYLSPMWEDRDDAIKTVVNDFFFGELAAELLVKQGTFTIESGTGNKAYENLWSGFKPKFVWVWTSYQTSAGTTDTAIMGVGGTDGFRSKCNCIVSDDAQATSDTSARRNISALLTILSDATTPTVGFEATLTGLSQSGMTINQTTNASGTNVVVHYLAIGGGQITDVRVDQFQNITSTGTQDITTPGFQPDIVMFWTMMDAGTGTANRVNAPMVLGFMQDATHQGTICVGSSDGDATMLTFRRQRNNACLNKLGASSGASDGVAEFSSMLSNGFQINWTEVVSGSAELWFYGAIKGATWDCGDFALTTGTGNQDVTTANDPKALMLWTDQSASTNPGSENHNALCIGATDGTVEGCSAEIDENGVADSETMRHHSTSKTLALYSTDVNATASSTTLDLDADATLASGKFTLNKTTNTGNQLARVLYISIGVPTPVGGLTKVKDESVEVAEAVNRVKTTIALSGESVEAVEAANRVLGLVRQVNE